MRTVSSPRRFATGAIRSSNLSPSPSSTTCDPAASGRPAVSVGKCSRSGFVLVVVVVMLVMFHRQIPSRRRRLAGATVVRLRCGLAAAAELPSDEGGVVSHEAE